MKLDLQGRMHAAEMYEFVALSVMHSVDDSHMNQITQATSGQVVCEPETVTSTSPSGLLDASSGQTATAPTNSGRATRFASQAHTWLGLVAAIVVATMIHAPVHPGWTVAITTGLLCSGIICALRHDAPGWPLEELIAGSTLCLAALLMAVLHATYGHVVWLYAVPVVLAGTLLLLWMLTQRTRATTVAARGMLAAIPSFATVMNCLC